MDGAKDILFLGRTWYYNEKSHREILLIGLIFTGCSSYTGENNAELQNEKQIVGE